MVRGHMDQVHSRDRDVRKYESRSGRNVTASGKFAFTWSDSGRLVPDINSSDSGQLASHSNHNPGFKSEDMDSLFSDTGDTFASLSFGDYNEGDGAVSPCPAERSDEISRDFIMRRFLPAAQALTTEAALSVPPSLVSKPSPFAQRTVVPMLPRPHKSRFAQEVKRDEVQNSSGDGDGGERILGGFASRLGRMTLKHLKQGFRTPTLSNKNSVPQKKLHDEISSIDSGVDLPISDDEEHCASEESNMKPPNMPNPKLKYLEQEDFSKDAVETGFQHGNSFMSGNFKRTSHTLNSQGFLGFPKLNNRNRETARVAIDTSSDQKMHMASQGNYVDSHVVRINEHEEIEGSSHGPSTSSSPADSPKEQLVGAVARRESPMLMPLPSLKSPSESWLCNTLPPASRFLAVKKMPQKALRRHPSHRPVRQIDQPLREVNACDNWKP